MEEYKLIATDMDDTLLNKNHMISKENREAIIDIQKKGIKFVLASGRPSFAMFEYAKELRMHEYGGYILGFNGGEIIDLSKGKTIFEKTLKMDDVRKIYKEAMKRDLSFLFYTEDIIYSNELNVYTREEIEVTKMKYRKIDDIESLDIKNVVKCMILGEAKKLLTVQKEMQEKYLDKYVINISKPIFMEFTSKGIDKGMSLKRLCEDIGIALKNTVCIGDSYNDISMLRLAGFPVAVENAREELKKISKYVTTSNNEHALKNMIEKIFEK